MRVAGPEVGLEVAGRMRAAGRKVCDGSGAIARIKLGLSRRILK
jgi:hypothetical protein